MTGEVLTTWDGINAQIDREFRCDHAESRLTVRVTKNGRNQYRRQCVRCGDKLTECLKFADLSPAEMESAVPFDDALERAWVQRRCERRNQLYQEAVAAEKEDWWRRYDSYLQTPRWKAKSRAVIARDKVCQACLSRPAVQAHHKDYRHVGNEPLFDLVGVCVECHRKLHDRDAIAYALRRNFSAVGA